MKERDEAIRLATEVNQFWTRGSYMDKLAQTLLSEVSRTEKLEARIGKLRDAVLNADRYFKAKDGEYLCDAGLSEKSARYAVSKALEEDGKE